MPEQSDMTDSIERQRRVRGVVAGRMTETYTRINVLPVSPVTPSCQRPCSSEGSHRLGYVLQSMMAEVLEFAMALFPELLMSRSRNAHPTGVGQLLNPGRQIHAVAVDVSTMR